jgi:uncharacterized tellurite resistance protein B-like protein
MAVLIIFGIRVRYRTLSEGTFYCPHDGGDRSYRRRQARRWFALFFIPVIPLKVLGEFIECDSCGSTYDMKVLTMPTAAAMVDNLANAMRQAVVSLITADGVVTDAEKEKGLEVMQRYADTPYTMANLEDDLKDLRHGDLADVLGRIAGMLNGQGKESLLVACVDLAAADSSIDERELAEIQRAGTALGLSPAHLKGVILQAKEQLGLSP